jgi:hypothetical protein
MTYLDLFKHNEPFSHIFVSLYNNLGEGKRRKEGEGEDGRLEEWNNGGGAAPSLMCCETDKSRGEKPIFPETATVKELAGTDLVLP